MSNIAEAFAQAAVITYVIGGAGVILWQIKPLRNAVKSWWHRTHAPKNKPETPPNDQPNGTKPHLRLVEKNQL